MQTRRIELGTSGATGNSLEFFVDTGSMEAPIVCLADNNGFPPVQDLYARARTEQGLKGIHISVRFDGQPKGKGLAVNISQPNMPGSFRVIPLA